MPQRRALPAEIYTNNQFMNTIEEACAEGTMGDFLPVVPPCDGGRELTWRLGVLAREL